jgi:phosphoribosylformylglycinamidine cyclo-ligase
MASVSRAVTRSHRTLRKPGRRRLSYRDAGVDIDAKMSAVSRFAALARSTFSRAVLAEIGSFGGVYDLSLAKARRPVLVSSIDGVGTKLKIAFLTGRHDTVGRDLVNHCVNDILVQGAFPLFFLDYLATGKVEGNVLESVVSGMAAACRDNRCALIGGETAEMPGFYAEGEYDLAGCIVGLAERDALLDGSRIRPGDLLLGLASSGLHTNGYSLARKVLLEGMKLGIDSYVPELGRRLGEELLEPHRSYLALLRPWISRNALKGMAHITGGGLTDNVPRILPASCDAEIDPASWEHPPIFRLIQQGGGVGEGEMRRTFNLGIGMVLVVAKEKAVAVRRGLVRKGERVPIIGRIVRGGRRVVYAGETR